MYRLMFSLSMCSTVKRDQKLLVARESLSQRTPNVGAATAISWLVLRFKQQLPGPGTLFFSPLIKEASEKRFPFKLPVLKQRTVVLYFPASSPMLPFICFAKLHIELNSSRLVCKCPRQGEQMTGGFS